MKLGATAPDALGLLDCITKDEKADQYGDLAAILLDHLYPSHISLEILLGYARDARCANAFRKGKLLTKVPPEHLPALLDQLVQRTDLVFSSQMIGQLLQQAIELHGEHTTDEKLFAWLWIGVDQGDNEEREGIASWLEAHPDRYKALLALCYQDCKRSAEIYGRNQSSKQRRSIFDQHPENLAEPISWLNGCKRPLYEAAVPEDLGLWHLKQVSQTDDEELAKNHLACAFELLNQRGGKGLTLEVLEAWGIEYPERQSWLDALLFCEIPEWRKEQAARNHSARQKRADTKRNNSLYLNQNKAEIHSGLYDLALIWKGEGKYRNLVGKTPTERFNDLCDNGDEILAAAEAGFRACVVRTDLPTADEIIALHKQGHWAQMPCLIGMDLRWQDNPLAIDALPDDILRRMIAFGLPARAYSTTNIPAWFSKLVKDRPALVADVLERYAIAILNSKQDDVYDICFLADDPSYREVALLVVPALLIEFPLRARGNIFSDLSVQPKHLQNLKSLLAAARRYAMPKLADIVREKATLIENKDMDDDQKIYWLTEAMLLDPVHHQAALWEYVGKDSARIAHLCGCLNPINIDLSADVLGKLIDLFLGAFYSTSESIPNDSGKVNCNAPRKFIAIDLRHDNFLNQLITSLGRLGTDQAAQELERLVQLPALAKLKFQLQDALHQLKLAQRERAFAFLSPAEVAQILANQAPTSSADLAALALDYLDGIAAEIRGDNEEGVLAFWNVENKKPVSQREENLCRSDLMRRLRCKFNAQGITCEPEPHQANNKRADIGLLYINKFKLPIEIKRNVNDALWTGLRTQLIEQYAIDPKADGYGIYLVLWFGSKDTQKANDGGEKPTSPEELKTRLEAQLNREERERIFIRVLDVTHPNQPV